MNNKGFTLAELIAVIAILLILGLLIIPNTLNIIRTNKERSYKEIERRLEEAAAKYILEQDIDISLNTVTITKEQLIEKKYIEEIRDLTDNSACSANVVVTDINTIPVFKAHLTCANYTS